jgi:pimeloyl-ACP methyl ester carboxylesterase
MTFKQAVAAAAASAAVAASLAGSIPSARAADAPTIVLVHGAWANGSSWARVVPLLQARGLDVIAVHNPLSSFEADVAATRRVIEAQAGDVILVGHSYGGAVITEAGTSNKVRALVYVAAFAPSGGESINAIVGVSGQPEWFSEIRADAGGMLTWSPKGMAKYFAPDLPPLEAALLTATQAPFFAGAFDGKVTSAAYRQKPSWYVVADDDRIIPAALQLAFARKMGAKTSHVASSHVPMLSQPQAVVDAILAAVDGAK